MFAVHCPRHGTPVLLDARRVTAVTTLAPGVIAVELTCYDGEPLVLVSGSRTVEPAPQAPHRDVERQWELVIPPQEVVVRLNGHAPDASPADFLPAVRPYGVVAMGRALRQEIPELTWRESVRVAYRAHTGRRAVASSGPQPLLDEIRLRLRTYHALVARLEPR